MKLMFLKEQTTNIDICVKVISNQIIYKDELKWIDRISIQLLILFFYYFFNFFFLLIQI